MYSLFEKKTDSKFQWGFPFIMYGVLHFQFLPEIVDLLITVCEDRAGIFSRWISKDISIRTAEGE
jgi:hypothetical protein